MIAAAVAVVASCLCLLGLFVYTYGGHDRPELIDSPEVAEVAERACTTMRAAVAVRAAPPQAATEAEVRAIRQQNDAVVAMVAEVRRLGKARLRDDHPTADWLSDWETLVDSRERHAAALSAGREPRFVVPVVDGVAITDRMNSTGLVCQVPPQLLDLP
ncbi:hypothetical protein [Micromonospora sp. NPDC007220]|uniref:hypothetical protein n=1 Tax=Micromonospora sp. NPDC007220 TaxID=3154318 RepID=UPI003401658E